jgi:CRAL/TRIO domain
MFSPGYAQIGRLIDGDTVAKRSNVRVGDVIVAVNGSGFRRFAPDFKESEVENLSKDKTVKNDNCVLHMGKGEAYDALLTKIKTVKAGGDPPLVLSLERYCWDAKVNSWPRFLEARDGDVPNAMKMLQDHEQWKTEVLPIDLTRDGLQEVLRLKAVAEIDIGGDGEDAPLPTVYVNFAKLQAATSISTDDVCKAFIIFTELMLARCKDPRNPKTCQFIDLSGVSISSGLRADMLRKIYDVFEPNYPGKIYAGVQAPCGRV